MDCPVTLYYFLIPSDGGSFDVRATVRGESSEIRLMDVSGSGRILSPIAPSGMRAETMEKGVWRLPLRRGRKRFYYTVQGMPPETRSQGNVSFIKRGNCIFFLGRDVFLRAFPSEACYRIHVDGNMASSLPARGIGWEAKDGRHLSLGGFIMGDFFREVDHTNGITVQLLVHWEMDRTAGILRPELLRFLRALTAFFGYTPGDSVSFFIFRKGEHDESSGETMGVGLSFEGGILLCLKGIETVDERNAWLILHEMAHQWLGTGVFAGEPGLEWFFEGMASWCAMTLARDLGYLTRQTLRTLLTRDVEHYLTSAKRLIGQKGPFHPGEIHQYETKGGLLMAYGLDQYFKRNAGGGLRDFLSLFYGSFKGNPVSERDLLGAIKKFGRGTLPKFIRNFLERKALLPFHNWF